MNVANHDCFLLLCRHYSLESACACVRGARALVCMCVRECEVLSLVTQYYQQCCRLLWYQGGFAARDVWWGLLVSCLLFALIFSFFLFFLLFSLVPSLYCHIVSWWSVCRHFDLEKLERGPKEIFDPEIQKELLVLEEQEVSVHPVTSHKPLHTNKLLMKQK